MSEKSASYTLEGNQFPVEKKVENQLLAFINQLKEENKLTRKQILDALEQAVIRI